MKEVPPNILEKWAKERPLHFLYVREGNEYTVSTVLAAFKNKRKGFVK
jgi:hypothetical protein